MGLLTAHPRNALEPPKTRPSPAPGLSGGDVQMLLAVIPDIVPGRRD
jgi:hypothetical protein